MWLHKLHISFSILCMLTFWGFRKICREAIEKNGWGSSKKKKSFLSVIWVFFIPFLNVLSIIVLFMMITTENEDRENTESRGNREEKGT